MATRREIVTREERGMWFTRLGYTYCVLCVPDPDDGTTWPYTWQYASNAPEMECHGCGRGAYDSARPVEETVTVEYTPFRIF